MKIRGSIFDLPANQLSQYGQYNSNLVGVSVQSKNIFHNGNGFIFSGLTEVK
jgi:hypothetical protein